MDINALGAQYMNQAYVPFSSSQAAASSAVQALRPADESAFEELLQRTRNAESAAARAASSAPDGVPADALAGASSGTPDGTFSSIPKNTAIDKNDKLYQLCMELETFLIKNLIKSMRGTVQKTKLIDPGFAGEVYEDMLYDEYAKAFAQNANLGFAEMAYRDLTRADSGN